jgi:hypothetical protein
MSSRRAAPPMDKEYHPASPECQSGVPAHAVRNATALEEAVTAALAAVGPTVIEAVVDSEHYMDTVYD